MVLLYLVLTDWQPQMLEAYSYLSGALNQIGSRTIVRHECVEEEADLRDIR
jgi:hypothetical protein